MKRSRDKTDKTMAQMENNFEIKALEQVADLLIKFFDEVSGNWQKPWIASGGSNLMPQNITGREYNGRNTFVLLLLSEMKGYKAPVFGTFKQFDSFNYTRDHKRNDLPYVSVKKGEKAFPVFFTKVIVKHKETGEEISISEYESLPPTQRSNYRVGRYSTIKPEFNIDQTDIKEKRPDLYDKLTKSEHIVKEMSEDGMFVFKKVDEMITDNQWVCPIIPTEGDQAYYSVSKDHIVIPLKKQFKNGESYYSNLFHEMAHSTGSKDRLDRLTNSSFGSPEYAKEELIAEMTAAVVSHRYGIEKTIKEDSVPYLKSWLKTLKESPSFIKTLLGDVSRAQGMIVEHIDIIQ